jgi:hypothetical protein
MCKVALSLLISLAAVAFPQALARPAKQPSAWESLVSKDPEIGDDASIGWRERLILHVLTPRQAEEYFSGRKTSEQLILENGRTLEEYLQGRASPDAGAYVPLPIACRLFEGFIDGGADGPMDSIERSPPARASDRLALDCSIDPDAVAVVLNLRAESLGKTQPRIKLWADGHPEPASATLEGGGAVWAGAQQRTVIVNLCREDWCGESGLRARSTEPALVSGDLIGYFRAPAATDTATPVVSFYTEGFSNNFFGSGAGSSNTTGTGNSFFGGNAGNENTTGSSNAFFGSVTGRHNTTGGSNSYFGYSAGNSNTNGSRNSFFGATAGFFNTASDNSFFGYSSGLNNRGGSLNAFFGAHAGEGNTTGSSNAFFGESAGNANTTGSLNSFFGRWAGRHNTSGASNSFFGYLSGFANTTGFSNAFFGRNAGQSNTTACCNSFFGAFAGAANTTGTDNSFFGLNAGAGNTTGPGNSMFGRDAGAGNTTGSSNSFFGRSAGSANAAGSSNSFFGILSGFNNTTGSDNSFFGRQAGTSNTIEHANTFIGALSGGVAGITNATSLGHRAQVGQSNSLVLGSIAGVNGAAASVNVGIGVTSPQRQLHLKGNNAVFRMDRDSDTAAFMIVRTNNAGSPLKTFVVGTNAAGANNGEFVVNDLGTAVGGPGTRRMTITNAGETHFTGTVRAPSVVQTSSRRFKADVETLRNASDVVDRLRGVTFVWKETGKPSVGLIAEEVAEVIPEVVDREENGLEAAGVNYAALVAVLVEAVKTQRSEIRFLRNELAVLRSLEARLSALEEVQARRRPRNAAGSISQGSLGGP